MQQRQQQQQRQQGKPQVVSARLQERVARAEQRLDLPTALSSSTAAQPERAGEEERRARCMPGTAGAAAASGNLEEPCVTSAAPLCLSLSLSLCVLSVSVSVCVCSFLCLSAPLSG
jgi:alkylation response protein AidB-like acyl-CoA dehydrogenase